MSFSGFAEVYFDWTHDSMSTSTLRDFVTKHEKGIIIVLRTLNSAAVIVTLYMCKLS